MSQKLAFMLSSVMLLLDGCASVPPVKDIPDTSVQALARSADQIQSTWNVLGGVEKASHPEYQKYLDDYADAYPDALAKPITVKWSGPIEPLMQMLSREARVSMLTVGVPPPSPVLVYVNTNAERIGDVLRDIGYQAGRRAGIRVIPTPGYERLELVYVPQ